MKTLLYLCGVAVVVLALPTASAAYNNPGVSVPEIDGSMLMSGLGLLSGGLMVLRARMR